jgi:hypothetical protein
MRFVPLLISLCISFQVSGDENWSIVDAHWRPDANPFVERQVWEDWRWVEGWNAEEQFYPEHFEPAGSLHVILRNQTAATATTKLTQIDGADIETVTTTPERAGPVVWHFVEPRSVAPGGWAEAVVRLRSAPQKDVGLSFVSDDGEAVDVAVPIDPRAFRVESISFSPAIDHLRVYVRSLKGGRIRRGTLRLDGQGYEKAARWSEGPGAGDLALVETELAPPWQPGSRHLVEVEPPRETKLVQPVRAWDSFFSIGLYGAIEENKIRDAIAHGINTYVTWSPEEILDRVGLNYVVSYGFGRGRDRTREQTGTLFYANRDEPDAHDFKLGRSLPLMQRLGVHAQSEVLPLLRQQREADPRTLNMILVNNTFKPLNWYIYGQIADVLCTDPYVPLSGEQLGRVPHSLAVARDAAAPHPVTAVLWAARLEGSRHHYAERAPTPKEERMMVFYAVGSGVKGLAYFMDHTHVTGEGQFTGVSDIPDLWEEVERMNRDIGLLAPRLSVGCPLPGGYEDERVWSRVLWCGRECLVVIVVNKDHYIAYNTRSAHPWHAPATNVEIQILLPRYFSRCQVREVRDSVLAPVKVRTARHKIHLLLENVDTARAFIITGEIER